MSLFRHRGSKIWWYDFKFAGQRVRESTKTSSRRLAEAGERTRRRELEEGFNKVTKRVQPKPFAVAAEDWLALKKLTLASSTARIEKTNLSHLNPVLGKRLISDIDATDVHRYQQLRLAEEASPKTINLEIGTLRAILRRNKLWANIQLDVRMLPASEEVGRSLSDKEELKLLEACRQSRSRSLFPAVSLALSTCMRVSELRSLRWRQIDFKAGYLTVGKSKTRSGTGRVIPLNNRARAVLQMWASSFPNRTPEHFVFPAEKYGASGNDFKPCVYNSDPTVSITNWKEAWEAAKKRSGVSCRFHDLRHTGCTRMLEGNVPYPVVANIMGWSASTMIRMSKRYGHIGLAAQRQALELLNGAPNEKSEAVTDNDKEGAKEEAPVTLQ